MNVPRSFDDDSKQHFRDAFSWRLEDSAGGVRTLSLRARKALRISEFQHDPAWMAVAHAGPGEEAISLVAEDEDGLVGLLTAHLGDDIFEYTLGGRIVLRKKVRQLTVHQGPVLAAAPTPSQISSCLSELARHTPPGALVYCSAVPVGSAFHRALTDRAALLRAGFRALKWGGEGAHAKIRWEGTVDGYLRSLDGKKRGNVKRAWQKVQFTRHRMRQFGEAHEVDEFLRDAAAIYAGSDRGHEHELGPLPTAGRGALIRYAAAEKAFLGFVLYVDEKPIAYRYGYIYGTTLFAISTAYDRGSIEHKPGAVIFFEMLQQLERSKLPITLIDLLPHDSAFKRDRANCFVQTQNFYLFPRSASWYRLYWPLAMIEATKPIAADVLQTVRKTLKL